MSCSSSVSGNLCGGTLTFVAHGGSVADPLVIGAPLGRGDFPNSQISFVADLSVTGGFFCPGATCTGLVGSPEPPTWGMMLIAFAGLGYVGYRKARNSRRPLEVA